MSGGEGGDGSRDPWRRRSRSGNAQERGESGRLLGGVGEVCGARVGGNGGGGRGELRRAMVAVAGGLGNRERAERVEGRGINRGRSTLRRGQIGEIAIPRSSGFRRR